MRAANLNGRNRAELGADARCLSHSEVMNDRQPGLDPGQQVPCLLGRDVAGVQQEPALKAELVKVLHKHDDDESAPLLIE